MRWQSVVFGLAILAVTGCGGDGSSSNVDAGPAMLEGTVAYVATECVDTLAGATAHQQLRLIGGDSAEVTVMDVPTLHPGSPVGLCTGLGLSRFGPFFLPIGAVQRLAVSPDGSLVVFEVTDAVALLALTPLPADMQGTFVVRSDGTALRRLGPASREPTFRIVAQGEDVLINVFPGFGFSPNGRLVAFTDLVPGSAGTEQAQVFVLDVKTGARTQLTNLPPVASENPLFPATCCPGFVDDDKVAFLSTSDPEGANPDGISAVFTVRTDGSQLQRLALPELTPGASLIPVYSITGPRPGAALFALPGEPENPSGPRGGITEVLAVDGNNLLQLTNFRRSDTSTPFLSRDGREVFLAASADPFGINSTQNCQIFSVSPLGDGLRQLTDFDPGEDSQYGCFFSPPPGCAVALLGQDARTDALVAYSSCDPFGDNPYGGQIFALRPDGSGMRQLTNLRGVEEAEDEVSVELPGPFAFSTAP